MSAFGGHGAGAVRDERARVAVLDRAEPALVALRDGRRDTRAARVREEHGAEPDESARGDEELHPDPARAVVGHRRHAALAAGQQLRHGAEVLLRDVHGQVLHGLVDVTIHDLGDHLRLAHGELESLAAHLLHEDGERELASALDLPRVGPVGGKDADRDVADELAIEAVLDLAGGDLAALGPARERRRVDADGHGDRGVVDRDERERARVVDVRERLADRDVLDARRRRRCRPAPRSPSGRAPGPWSPGAR